MKIKRLCAANIREAMRKVREELGPDAVILSNRRTGEGFEIVAAVDYDEKLLRGAQQSLSETVQEQRPQETSGSVTRKEAVPLLQPTRISPESPLPVSKTEKPRVVWSQDPLLVEMRNEIKAMHNLLEQQLSGLAWGDIARRQPHRAELLEQLMDFGLSSELCLRLADATAAETNPERAWELALETLSKGLSVTNDDILTHGGVVALVGPTGVGKTTTVAKLAARYTLRHGPRSVALITTDSYRIGAFEQLRTFGVILDIPVVLVSSGEELQQAIGGFADRSLILIDTAGMSQRDLRLSQQFALLNGVPKIKVYLVLAANAQLTVIKETAAAFAQVPLSGGILTKVDETTRLGGALTVIHDQDLPLAYISNGQRVPEDLQVARVDALMRLGAEYAGLFNKTSESEALALTFGRKVAYAGF
jgi:flagellar biosynthesis protein FlhF